MFYIDLKHTVKDKSYMNAFQINYLILRFFIFVGLLYLLHKSLKNYLEIQDRYKSIDDWMVEIRTSKETDQMKKICWIFNEKSSYQVLLSLCSILKSNPGEKFAFYFILPPNISIDTTKYTHFLRYGSKIYIRHYKPKHTQLSIYSNLTCRWPTIIIAKLFLYDILPDVDKILYLDTDVINNSPISQLWKLPLQGKTMAATERIHYSNRWINSGVIFYNLNQIRKQPSEFWTCANRKTCFVDDSWHTYCHKKNHIYIIPYRYNVEFGSMSLRFERFFFQIKEEKNAVFYHLKDIAQEFYRITNRDQIKYMEVVRGMNMISVVLNKLFDLKNWIDNELLNLTQKQIQENFKENEI